MNIIAAINIFHQTCRMKKSLFLLLTSLLLTCCCNAPMPRGNWSDAPYKALCGLMKQCREEAAEAGRNVNYAVFDYDNTTVLQDVEYTFTAWRLENLSFKFTPDEVIDLFTADIPDPDCILLDAGAENVTSRMLISDMAADYREMMADAGVSCGHDLSKEQVKALQDSDLLLDFKAKAWALYDAVAATFGIKAATSVLMAMNHGISYDEFAALAREGIAAHVAKNRVEDVLWESPAIGAAGKVSVTVPDGLALTGEMRRLYKALPENGIDVYIFSASMEALVEVMACDPAYLGLDTAQVFAMRMQRDSTGLILQAVQPGYIQPCKAGKTEAIKAYVAPKYGGRGPVLVGGDSNGDYSMLTSFPDMRVGLIIDKGQTGAGIGDLRRQALDAEAGGVPSVYVLQRRADPKPEFKRE